MYRLLNIVKVTKSGKLKCTGHIARMEKGKIALKMLTDKPKSTEIGARMVWLMLEDNCRIYLKEIVFNFKI